MTETAGRRGVILRLNRARLWRWQHELAICLASLPNTDLAVRLADGPPVPRAFTLLAALEKFAFRLNDDHACDLVDKTSFDRWLKNVNSAEDHHVLDLTGLAADEASFRILYDGVASDDAAILAVLDRRSPTLKIVDSVGRTVVSGLAAVEDRTVATRALNMIFSAVMQLCMKAVVAAPVSDTQILSGSLQASRELGPSAVLSFGVKALSAKLNDRITHLCRQAPRWFVAWRPLDAEELEMTLPAVGAYQRLADDGGRYYADPFLFVAGGQTHLFVEEYDMVIGKGLISASVLSSDGFSRPRPVLETAFHLSYPHVFTHAGEIWMIPESLRSKSVDLYRATSFPDGWVHQATLLDGIEASDATVCQHRGLWWMFAATRHLRGSNWDTLSVFWAEQLEGPWLPHALNPVLVDSRCARPAGAIFEYEGALWRPAQDCIDNYGAGLALCRIDALDRDTVSQSVRATIRLREAGVLRGPHTLNRTNAIEVIDLYGTTA